MMRNVLIGSSKKREAQIRNIVLGIAFLFITLFAGAQTTLNTTAVTGFSNNNGSGTVTFNFQNNNAYDIIITDIEGITGTAGANTAQLYIKTTPVNGSPGAISAANGWNLAASQSFTGVSNTSGLTTQVFMTGISVTIPANTTYGMVVFAAGQRYHTMVSPNIPLTTVTNGGCSILMGTNISYGGGTPPAIPGNSPRGWLGKITFIPALPCVNPPTVTGTTTTKSITCSGESFQLGLSGFSSGTGQTYQWQSSPDSLIWTNIVGATSTSLVTTQTTTTYYRCAITCTSTVYSPGRKVTTSAVALPGGTYTINGSLATGGTNFNSFTDFRQAIVCGGIAGPIVVNVIAKGSPYAEQIEFGNIGGTSATNTITINGNGQELTSAGGATYATLRFNGAKFFKVKKLIIKGTGTTNNFAVHITGGAESIELDSITASINPSATSSTTAAIVVSGSLTSATTAGLSGKNIIIKNSTIEGGYYGLTLTGPSTAPFNSGSVIQNNVIRDFYLYGLYVGYQDSVLINRNDIHRMNRTGTITTFYGLYYIGNATDGIISNNRVHNPADQNPAANFSSYPIYFSSANATAADPMYVTNNAVYELNGTGLTNAFYVLSGTFLKFFHNTINLDNPAATTATGTQRAFHFGATTGDFELKNNVFQLKHVGSGAKHLIYLTSTVPTYSIDYNQYYMSASAGTNNFGFYGTTVATFAAWKALNSGAFDANGFYGDAVFDTSSYKPQSSVGNNNGTNLLTVVPTDIFGVARTATPDRGAAEFTPLSCLQPFNITGTANGTSVTLNWTNVAGADSVRIEYGPQGFIQGTGIGIFRTGTTTIITGLSPQTCYDFYLKTYCSGTPGNGVALFTICTPCGNQLMPYLQTFTTWVPSCFSLSTNSTWNWTHNTTGYAVAAFWSNSTGIATMKTANVAISQAAQVKFKWAHQFNTTYPDDRLILRARILGSTTWDTLADLVGPTFNTTGGGTTTPPPAANFATHTSYLTPNYVGQVAEFEFLGLTDFGPNVFVDDFEVSQVPPCTPPINPTIGAITPTTAQVSWSTINGTCFRIEYGPQGYSQGTGTSGTVINNVTSPTTIPGLTPNTFYDVYVQDCCNPNLWVGPITFKTACLSALSGTYTINKNLPASATNFISIKSFADALTNCGISGPVTATVVAATGPYTEQVTFGPILGSSATNTVTLNGNANVLQFASSNANLRGTLFLNGADYVTINNLEIFGSGTTNCNAVEMRSTSQNITFDDCYIRVDKAQTSSLVNAFVMSDNATSPTAVSAAFTNITVKNSIIEGGYYGVVLNGPSAAPWSTGNVIENNEIRDFYIYGIYGRGQLNASIKGNDINRANRGTVTTFYGIFLTGQMEGVEISGNQVHNGGGTSGNGTFTAYPYYLSATVGTSTSPTRFTSNLLYNVETSGTIYGLYVIGATTQLQVYHNTLDLSFSGTSTGTIRNIFISSTTGVFDIRNNILSTTHSGTGTKHLIYLSSTVPTYTINYNQYHIAGGGTGNHIGYYTTNQTTLAAWQAVNSGAFEQNGVQGDPVYASPSTFNMTPLGGAGNNNALNLNTAAPTDFYGVTRGITPDRGAIEFTPLTADIALTSGLLNKGQCLSTNDTVQVTLKNVIGSTVDFSLVPANVVWNVTGPMTSNGTITLNSGTLANGASVNAQAFTVNLSKPGFYNLTAYLQPNATNQFLGNDTLENISFEVKPIFAANPQSDTVFNAVDSVEISVQSPFLGGGDFFFSEICHFKTTNGAPVGGWPTYLLADDYVEITGVPGSDLGGYTLEQWSATALLSSYTFPTGTVLSPNGTCILAVGQMGSSVPSPANYYYHGNGTYTGTFGSTIVAGRVLKNASNAIVDAVGYGTYTFPAAANVTSSDWSGNTPAVSSSGNKLNGPDNNTAANWVNSGTNPQNPNTLNANVILPNPTGTAGFSWSHNGAVIDTNVTIFVGPWPAPGVYHYVATYTASPCGTLSDTVTIYVQYSLPCDAPTNVTASGTTCAQTVISWTSDPDKLTSKIEYGPAGFTPGTGTVVSGVNSPYTAAGLTPGTNYDFYVRDSCALGLSNRVLQPVATPTGPLPTVTATATVNVSFTQADVQFSIAGSSNFTTLLWDFGDGTSGVGPNPTHTYAANGTYTVVVTATNDCGTTTYTFTVVVAGIGLNESELANGLNIYPNPNNGAFVVEFDATQQRDVELRITNLLGEVIAIRNMESAYGKQRFELDLSNQAAGVYIVQLITDDGSVNRRVTVRK